METVKQVLRVHQSASTHWVGDGFHVRNLFPSNDLGQQMSPFLLLDYAARLISRQQTGRVAWANIPIEALKR